MDESRDWFRRYTQEDLLASTLRASLSLVGPFGAIFAEFLTQFVPNQRIDRLHDFIEQLNDRLGDIEEEFKAKLASSAGFSALVEQVAVAAVRTASAKRRQELAALVRHGLTRADAEAHDHQALLRLLEQINDAQVLILMRFGNFKGLMNEPERDAFVAKYAAVFDVEAPALGDADDTEDRRRWYMYQHYEDELVRLNLLEDTEGVVKSSYRRSARITALGRMLLSAIGRSAER